MFDGKIAVVTGAAAGFGRAFAEALGQKGASVALLDIDGNRVEHTARQLTERGYRALSVTCDVADEAQVDTAVARVVEELGGVDILINNAGLHLTRYNQPFSALTRAEVRALFDVNVMGVINCSLACRESMRSRGGGSIVNISSMASYASRSPYGVSKLAVRGLTIAFATEFAPMGIRCNAIAPGLIATESALADLPQETVDSIVKDRQLIHRLGQVDDIVQMMLFLCSERSSFITGETFKVSGGTPLWI